MWARPGSRGWQGANSRNAIAQGENRIPPAVAIIAAAAAYGLLPDSLLFTPRLLIPALELALLVALLVANPRRMVRQTRSSRAAAVVLVAVVITTNLVALAMLVGSLSNANSKGTSLLPACRSG